MNISTKVMCIILVLIPVIGSAVQPSGPGNPPNPPVQLSKDLGVTTDQFTGCCKEALPPGQAHQVGPGGQDNINKAILLRCLQKYNPNITSQLLNEMMYKDRPE